jgi:MFS family permease
MDRYTLEVILILARHVYGQAFGDSYIIPALWLGLWNAAIPIGAIAGSIWGGLFQDWLGRRWSIVFATTLSAICVAVAFVSDIPPEIDTRRTVFLIAKGFQGFGNGMILCTVETYMSETLPPPLRGPGLALFPIASLFGQLIGSIVVQTSLGLVGAASYRTCFASQWPFTAIPLVVAIFLPESPAWLVRVQRRALALKCHQRLNSVRMREADNSTFAELEQAVALEQKRSDFRDVTYWQCFEGIDRRRTGVVIFAHVVPNLFGLPLFATAAYFLQTIGMEVGLSVIFIIIGVVLGLFSNIGAFWTLTFFGRRFLLLSTLSVASVLWITIGVAGCFSGKAMIL